MDGFVSEHEGDEEEAVMGYHVREQLNVLYQLVDAYTVCDRWSARCSAPPGRTASTSTAPAPRAAGQLADLRRLRQRLPADGGREPQQHELLPRHPLVRRPPTPGHRQLGHRELLRERGGGHPAPLLADRSAVLRWRANDDHPDHDIALGQALIASIYQALAQSEQWEKTLFIITYDEHGGFFDHVPPPVTVDANPEFTQLGVRVPAVVISPFARQGCAVSQVFEHSTIASTLAKRYGFDPINARAAATSDISPCIDPKSLGPRARRRPSIPCPSPCRRCAGACASRAASTSRSSGRWRLG